MSEQEDKRQEEAAQRAEETQPGAAETGNGTAAGEQRPADEQAAGGQGPGGQGGAEADAGAGPEETLAEGEAAALEQEFRETVEAMQDKYLRLQAEFENYKRRIQKEHAESMKYALTPLLEDLIGIMDNLERAVEHARSEQGDSPLLSGIEMVVKQLGAAFEKHGVTRIEAVGQPFDPNRHEAMSVVETDEVPDNYVAQEFQAGYLLNDRVVRPAMVSVARNAGQGG